MVSPISRRRTRRRSSTSRPVRPGVASPSSATRAHASRDRRDPAMLGRGCERITHAGATRGRGIRLVAGKPSGCRSPRNVRALTFTYLMRYVADPTATLRELAACRRARRDDRELEFAVPESRFWRTLWVVVHALRAPGSGFVTGGREWYEVGRFLGPDITNHYRRHPVSSTVRAWRRSVSPTCTPTDECRRRDRDVGPEAGDDRDAPGVLRQRAPAAGADWWTILHRRIPRGICRTSDRRHARSVDR